MKKFKFRLQSVLDMREKELEKKQQEMAGIVKILNSQIEELEYINSKSAEVLASLENMYNEASIDVTTISGSNGYLIKLEIEAKKQNQIIQNTKNVMQMKQLEINEVYKKVKVLEKLKEKQEKEYYKEFEVKTAKEIDDIVTTRYKVS